MGNLERGAKTPPLPFYLKVILWILFSPLSVLIYVATHINNYALMYFIYGGKYRAESWKLHRFVFWYVLRYLLDPEAFNRLVRERNSEMGKLFGVKTDEVIRYVAKSQRGDSDKDQVIWKLKFLTVKEFADIQDELFESKGFGKKRQEKFLLGKQTMLALRIGLQGWDNFKFADGTEVVWDDPSKGRDLDDKYRIVEKNLNKIPPEIRTELADYIRGESTLGEPE
jgi:hypothetical protein